MTTRTQDPPPGRRFLSTQERRQHRPTEYGTHSRQRSRDYRQDIILRYRYPEPEMVPAEQARQATRPRPFQLGQTLHRVVLPESEVQARIVRAFVDGVGEGYSETDDPLLRQAVPERRFSRRSALSC